MPILLAPLWIYGPSLSDAGAAALGLPWLIGRNVYAAGYRRAVEKQLVGFLIQTTACILLFIGAATGAGQRILAG